MAFPARLFVTEETENDGTKYHIAHRRLDDTVETGQRRIVGVYKLTDWVRVKAKAEVIAR